MQSAVSSREVFGRGAAIQISLLNSPFGSVNSSRMILSTDASIVGRVRLRSSLVSARFPRRDHEGCPIHFRASSITQIQVHI